MLIALLIYIIGSYLYSWIYWFLKSRKKTFIKQYTKKDLIYSCLFAPIVLPYKLIQR